MSALSDLVYGKDHGPWPYFTDKYPVKVKNVAGMSEAILSDGSSLNDQLEKDIREAGDYLSGRTPAKCLMTRWDMHAIYPSFVSVSMRAIEIAKVCPLATRTDTDGNPLVTELFLNDTWGLIYAKGQSTTKHNHWPHLWSYTYCVFGCENCSPLVFSNAQEPLSITPKTSQMVVFPAWLQHEVPTQTCKHDRIMISGNLNIGSADPHPRRVPVLEGSLED